MAMYRGFIFGSMSATGPSLDEYLGNARRLIDDFTDLAPSGEIELRAGVLKHRYEGNWKMAVENIVDAYHPPFVHQSGFSLGNRGAVNLNAIYGEKSIALTRDLGGGHAEIDSTVEVSGDRQWQRATFSDPVAEAAQRDYAEAVAQRVGPERMQYLLGAAGPRTSLIFPNLQFLVNQVRVVQPISVDRSVVYYYPAMLKGAPAAVNAARLRQIEGAHGPAGFVAPDDIDVYERNQEGFQARDNEWLMLRRGLHREKLDPNGLVIGEASDELTQRAIWRRYKDLMARP
jgi:phenylpropionate dioxygenase-like ring-hydroxylating dioxygenase large terminal subunit